MMFDHIDPYGYEFAVACPRCNRVHTRKQDEEVKLRWAARGLCCDLHNEHCEPPSELCCGECTEWHHGLHSCPGRLGLSHDDGSVCVLDAMRAEGLG